MLQVHPQKNTYVNHPNQS